MTEEFKMISTTQRASTKLWTELVSHRMRELGRTDEELAREMGLTVTELAKAMEQPEFVPLGLLYQISNHLNIEPIEFAEALLDQAQHAKGSDRKEMARKA